MWKALAYRLGEKRSIIAKNIKLPLIVFILFLPSTSKYNRADPGGRGV
jgi:hypothetical protein